MTSKTTEQKLIPICPLILKKIPTPTGRLQRFGAAKERVVGRRNRGSRQGLWFAGIKSRQHDAGIRKNDGGWAYFCVCRPSRLHQFRLHVFAFWSYRCHVGPRERAKSQGKVRMEGMKDSENSCMMLKIKIFLLFNLYQSSWWLAIFSFLGGVGTF